MLFLLELFFSIVAVINFCKVEIASYLSAVAAGTQQRLQTGGNCGGEDDRQNAEQTRGGEKNEKLSAPLLHFVILLCRTHVRQMPQKRIT